MKKKTQKERIISKLIKDGYVTRNEALKNYISRLSALIFSLEKEGWKFSAKDMPDGDYKYEVIENPIKPVLKPSIIMVDGIAKAVYN